MIWRSQPICCARSTASAIPGAAPVASGLVHVRVAGQTPAVRYGEVLVTDSERVERWRNLGQAEAVLFWIVVPARNRADPRTWV